MNRFDSLRALVSLVPCVTALALGTHAVAQVPAAAPHAAAPATSQTSAPAAALLPAPSAPAANGADTTSPLPPHWQAPLPHGGTVAKLADWWRQFDDPLVAQLVTAAQAVSPDVASAAARIAQAEAVSTAAGAARLPGVNASAGLARGRADLFSPPATSLTAGVALNWELDILGGQRAAQQAALWRLAGAEASWHGARVTVAADVASLYLALRACEAQAALDEAEHRSREHTARLTALTQQAGLASGLQANLAEAGAAQASAQLRARRVQCAQAFQALRALTGVPAPELTTQLAPRTGVLPVPAQLAVGSVPARVLGQRPDLFTAARAVEAAAADVREREADRLPRVSLSGSLSAMGLRMQGARFDGNVWSFGPLQVSLPLFDGGRRDAQVRAAQAAYDEAVAQYRGRLSQAVKEVEDALTQTDQGALRHTDAERAAHHFAQALSATEAQARAGLASHLELEDARRNALASQAAALATRRERVDAWVALYRALGGGWEAPLPQEEKTIANNDAK
jgi:multidrug efflux system outer membrane protein